MTLAALHSAMLRTLARRAWAMTFVNAAFPLLIAALLAGATAERARGDDYPVTVVAGQVGGGW